MKRNIKNYFLIYVLGLLMLVFSVMYPDAKITLTGGFAWFLYWIATMFGLLLIWTGIFGGDITIESKGLIGWIKEKKQNIKEEGDNKNEKGN